MTVSSSTRWAIDKRKYMMTHPSGLYAYFATDKSADGSITCAGPFSSYSHRLTKADVFRHAFTAIQELEASLCSGSRYSLWGTYCKLQGTDEEYSSNIHILGEDFNFIPNPGLRTSVLLSGEDSQLVEKLLLREWNWFGDQDAISHRSGLHFRFSRDKKRHLYCDIDTEGLIPGPHRKLAPLVLKAFSSAALSVLHRADCVRGLCISNDALRIRVATELMHTT